jgi:adenosylmethionine-8-amino-7-oxononanoate aminotransferase
MLRELREWCDRRGVLLILDEVMTGFGRTGTMFACEQEGVVPDLIALAKGLTGGYLPLAATMTTERIYEAFLGGPERTLYYGHSYTGNQLACAVALENLAIFREERVLETLGAKIALLRDLLERQLRPLAFVHDIRQCGFIAGIELGQTDGDRFPAERLIGPQVCLAARAHGLLTRPILDTIVLLPPYCITEAQLRHAVAVVRMGVEEVCG